LFQTSVKTSTRILEHKAFVLRKKLIEDLVKVTSKIFGYADVVMNPCLVMFFLELAYPLALKDKLTFFELRSDEVDTFINDLVEDVKLVLDVRSLAVKKFSAVDIPVVTTLEESNVFRRR
jgi:hypothetical protein